MPAVPPRLPRTRRTVTRNDTGHTDMPQGRQHRPHSSNQPIAVMTHALLADPGQRTSTSSVHEDLDDARAYAVLPCGAG